MNGTLHHAVRVVQLLPERGVSSVFSWRCKDELDKWLLFFSFIQKKTQGHRVSVCARARRLDRVRAANPEPAPENACKKKKGQHQKKACTLATGLMFLFLLTR